MALEHVDERAFLPERQCGQSGRLALGHAPAVACLEDLVVAHNQRAQPPYGLVARLGILAKATWKGEGAHRLHQGQRHAALLESVTHSYCAIV